MFQGKELPLAKKAFETVLNWLDKRSRSTRFSNDNASLISRVVFEAVLYSYGKVMTPDAPYFSLFNFLNARDIALSTLKSPKLMFTVLNGGKALGSKVKFAAFYLIIEVLPNDETADATEIYNKVSTNIKK